MGGVKRSLRITTGSPASTKKLGRLLGRFLGPGQVLALTGELGSGKTTLVKGIAKGLGVPSEKAVSSPTFTLIHEYEGREKIYHLDWYRLSSVRGADAELAGECFSSPAVTVVEWPERGKALLPKNAWKISIEHEGPAKRHFSFVFPADTDPGLIRAIQKI